VQQIPAASIAPVAYFVLVEEKKNLDERTPGGLYRPASAKVEVSPMRRGTLLALGPGWMLPDGTVRPLPFKVGEEILMPAGQGVMTYEDDKVQQFLMDAAQVIARVV